MPLNHEHFQNGGHVSSNPNSPRMLHSVCGSATSRSAIFGMGNPLIPTTTVIGLGTIGLGDRCAAERKRMHREQYQQWKRNKEVQQAQERLNNGGLTPKKPLTSKEMYAQVRQADREKQERRLEREMETVRLCREETTARKSELTQSRADEHAFQERFLQYTMEERERARAERAAKEAAKQQALAADEAKLRQMHENAKEEVAMVETLAHQLDVQTQHRPSPRSSTSNQKGGAAPAPSQATNDTAAASSVRGGGVVVLPPAPPSVGASSLPSDTTQPKSLPRRSDAAVVSPQSQAEALPTSSVTPAAGAASTTLFVDAPSSSSSPPRGMRMYRNSPTNHMSPKGESIGANSPRVQRQLVHTVMKEYDALYAMRATVAHNTLQDALDEAGEAVEQAAKEKQVAVEKCVKQHHRRQKWIHKMDSARETEFKSSAKELKTELVQRMAQVQERLFENHTKDADKIREARSSPRTRSSNDMTAQHRLEEERLKQRLEERRQAQEMHQAAIEESKEMKRAAAGDVRKLKSELAEERTMGSSELLEWKRRLHDDTKAARTRSPKSAVATPGGAAPSRSGKESNTTAATGDSAIGGS